MRRLKMNLGLSRVWQLSAAENNGCTVRKMNLILHSIERMLQTQLSMARRFKLQVLRRYNVKFSKMRNFTFDTLGLEKLKSTGGRRTNTLGSTAQDSITAPPTSTLVMKAEFEININTFCHI
jgi:hypothetical protein